jgi:DNA-binding transcriptional regulator YiaG
VFAQLLAVTPKTLQGWEQGKPAPRIARRLLDLIDQNPTPWTDLLRAAERA